MPRTARIVFPGIPHHVTQRGNRGEDVFHNDGDRFLYLDWLRVYAKKQDVDVLAYCLMTNHLHLVVVPNSEDGIHRFLKPLHMRYAQRKNREFGWQGHFWQGRYFSSPLDESYMWAAIRYVERNPVRANMVDIAEDYPWSSAAAHCGKRTDDLLTTKRQWRELLNTISDWSNWLLEVEKAGTVDILRRNTGKGLPCGSDAFIDDLEERVKHVLHYRPRGRPPKCKMG